jgi:uncharacterized protein
MKQLYQLIITSLLSIILYCGLITTAAEATGVYDFPIINAGEDVWVFDQADTLSRATENQLNNTLRDLAEKTGNEVRTIIVRRIDYDLTMDTFVKKLFKTWFTTPQEQANQTLIAIDTLTNNTAMITGEGLKAILTPKIITSITEETITIPLKELQYNQALLNASDRLSAILSGKEDPGPPEIKEISAEGTFTTAEDTDDRNATIWVIVLLVVATIIPMVTYFWYVGFPGS